MPHTDDDSRLLTAFRMRDRSAFDALFDRHAGRLLAFALRLTGGCRADAEDLVQETFVAAYRGANGFRGGARMLTYLTSILVRRHRDDRRRTIPESLPLYEETDHPAIDDHASRIEARTVANIAFEIALARLDEPMRTAFLLVAGQGMTHREAAALLGAPVGTIKWRVAEATKRLRTTLTEMETDERQSDVHQMPETSRR